MCASHFANLLLINSDLQVSPLSPPVDAPIGERIYFTSNQNLPLDPGKQSSKLFEKLAPGFFVNDDGIGMYKGMLFLTTVGPCTSTVIGQIS